MTIIYRHEQRNEYLYLVGEGVEDGLVENQQIHQMIVSLCKEYHRDRVLIDDQKVIYTASLFSIFELAEFYARADIPRRIRRAAIVASPAYKETNVFFENTARNRGIDLRIFYSHEEAEVWLLRE